MSKVEETGDNQRLEFYNRQQYSYNKFNGRIQPFNYYKMSNLRIIQKKLVYVIGLSSDLANRDVNYNLLTKFSPNCTNTNILDNTAK
jgi:hypothetical protein